jgi:hypothetical protein
MMGPRKFKLKREYELNMQTSVLDQWGPLDVLRFLKGSKSMLFAHGGNNRSSAI